MNDEYESERRREQAQDSAGFEMVVQQEPQPFQFQEPSHLKCTMAKFLDALVIKLSLSIIAWFQFANMEITKEQSIQEADWISTMAKVVLGFWLIVVILLLLKRFTAISIFSFTFSTIYMVSATAAVVLLTIQGFKGNFEMKEGLFFNEKTTQAMVIHQTFLVMRILSVGLAMIIGVSLIYYIRTLLRDGPLLLFTPSEEQRRLPGSDSVELDAQARESNIDKRRKAAVMREQCTPGYIYERLPITTPFRRLFYQESIQCCLCLERFTQDDQVMSACLFNHFYHEVCSAELRHSMILNCVGCPRVRMVSN